ncbi:hypothetical protein Tco_0595679 [Tanacetum coccineum]
MSNRCISRFLLMFLRQIHEEFRDGIGPSNGSGENPPPVTIHTRFERFNKQNPHSFDNAAAPKDAENRISQLEEILMFSRQEDSGECSDMLPRNGFKRGQGLATSARWHEGTLPAKELPGISSIRDVEYDIEFASGAKPIAEAPYRISPEHEDHLRTVIQILRQEKLYAKFSKCKFWLSKVVFLGHVVPAEGITMDPAKVEVVTKWPRSTSETEARSFLGLAGHYHRVVEDVSDFQKCFLNKGIDCTLMRHEKEISYVSRDTISMASQEIVQPNGTPHAIVSDKDPRFTFRILETHTRQEGYTNKLSRPLKLSAKLSCFLESIAYEWRQTFWYYRQDLFHQTIRNSRSRREISYRLAYLLSYHTFMMYFTCFVQKSQVSFLSRCLLSTRSDS